jgi:uncharacterized protein (TIGR02246 family)
MNPETSQSTISQSTGEAVFRALYQQLMDGWNEGSGAAFATPFAEDGDLIGFDGTHLKGRREIAQFHQGLFETYLKGSRLVGQVTSSRFLSPNAALIHAVGGTVMRGKSAPSPERDSIQTLVLRKHNGEWRIAAFQNTRVRPMGASFIGALIWIFSDWLWKLFGPKKRPIQTEIIARKDSP